MTKLIGTFRSLANAPKKHHVCGKKKEKRNASVFSYSLLSIVFFHVFYSYVETGYLIGVVSVHLRVWLQCKPCYHVQLLVS